MTLEHTSSGYHTCRSWSTCWSTWRVRKTPGPSPRSLLRGAGNAGWRARQSTANVESVINHRRCDRVGGHHRSCRGVSRDAQQRQNGGDTLRRRRRSSLLLLPRLVLPIIRLRCIRTVLRYTPPGVAVPRAGSHLLRPPGVGRWAVGLATCNRSSVQRLVDGRAVHRRRQER